MTITPAGYIVFACILAFGWGAWWLTQGIKRQVFTPPKAFDLLAQAFVFTVLFHLLSLFVLGVGMAVVFAGLGVGILFSWVDAPVLDSEQMFGALSGVFGLAIIVTILGFCLIGAFLLATGRDMKRWGAIGSVGGYDVIVPVMMVWFLSGLSFALHWHFSGVKVMETGALVMAGVFAALMVFAIVGYVSMRVKAYREG